MGERFTTPIIAGPTDVALVGGKGAGLCRLIRLGFTVPAGFCVTTEAYRATLARAVLEVDTAAELRARIRTTPFPAAVRAAILRSHDELVAVVGPRLVVRSSSTHEDGRTTSFAGQAATFLDVRGHDELLDHIRQCWASLFRDEGLLYGPHGRSDARPPEMAVIVQARVAARSAGVLFSTNPLSGNPSEALVCSAFGLGEGVVAGGATDTYAIDKETGFVRARHLAEKSTSLEEGAEGRLERVALPPERAARDSLSPAELVRLAAAGVRLEREQGAPQDVEWAIDDGGRLVLLQARPITAGRGLAAGDEGRPPFVRGGNGKSLWCNVNVGEALPGVGTPMTWSVLRAFSRRGFEEAFAALGLSVPKHYELVGNFRGRVYLNLTEFMSVASQIPFFPPERLLTLGGGGGLSGLKETYVPGSPLLFMLRLPLTLPRMAASQVFLPWLASSWTRAFERYRMRFYARNLESLSEADLLEVLESLTTVFNRTGTLMLAGASNALSSYIAVIAMLKRWGGAASSVAQERLFVGLSSVSSAAPGLALLGIALAARRCPAAARVLTRHGEEDRSAAEVLASLRASRESAPVADMLETFLEIHGHRAAREAELSTPRWRDDPSFLLNVLATHMASSSLPDPAAVPEELARIRKEATREVVAAMPAPIGPVFAKTLALAQDAARRREALRSEVVHTLAMYRHFVLEVGRRLVREGLVAKADDVFFLTMDEVSAWLTERSRGQVAEPMMPALRVAARRAEYETFCRAPDPPDTFTLSAGRLVAETTMEEPLSQEAAARVLRGLPGSPGQVRGVARVLDNPRDGEQLRPGEILVAPYTDVGWTPLFLVAGGVIMELGGALSHSCVVAREYGIPAVVNLKQATTRIEDGQIVTVDGDNGLVYLSAPPDSDPAPQASEVG